MADLKISQLTSATLPLAGTEVLPIVQSSSTKKVATDDLTVKNVRSNATTGLLQIAGPGAGTTRTMTTPNANFTVARTDAAQSFTGDQTLGTGNLIQGTAAKGFNFSANTPAAGMTSQLLNWYEEGTWTPSLGGNETYSTLFGKYVRIGKQVTVSFVIQIAVLGTGSTSTVSGLPFTVANNNQFHNAGSLAYFDSLAISVVSIVPYAIRNSNVINFNVLTAAGTASTLGAAIFQNGTYLIGNVTYLMD